MQHTPNRILVAGTGYGVGKTLVLRAIAAYQTATGAPWATTALTQNHPGAMDLAASWRSLQSPTDLLIEAVGSLGTPITPESPLADLAWDWRLPTLLVAAVTPHCLDHLVAYSALARQARCDVKGIVLNCTSAEAQIHCHEWAAPQQVSTLTQLPILGELPYCADLAEFGQDSAETLEANLAEMGARIDLSGFEIRTLVNP